ncbi:hypothetical protein AB1Y20_017491 [Prymnesium parvum]|uniref:Uncharacterized protein n=1 Tax=Prymnesium parvum TaxID=97485 RepID=A0AB34JPJ6_PRYPA
MTYFLARPSEEAACTSFCCAAQLDPNALGAVGVSFEDGIFRYHHANSSLTLQLFSSTLPVAATPTDSHLSFSATIEQPVAITAAWACWSFVPGRPRLLVIALARSPHLLLTSLPLPRDTDPPGGAGVRASICEQLQHASPISALCSGQDEWVGAGQHDGSVTFFRLPPEQEAAFPPRAALSQPRAHKGAVSSITLLHDVCDSDDLFEAMLGASGAADNCVIVYDLRASCPLYQIITADASPVSSLHLRLLAAGRFPAHTNGPSVLLAMGSNGGGVQTWLLTSSAAPNLLACWEHHAGGAILTLSVDTDAERLLSVSAALAGEIEIHELASWRLLHVLHAPSLPHREESEQGAVLRGAYLAAATTGGAVPLLLCRRAGVQVASLTPPFSQTPCHNETMNGVTQMEEQSMQMEEQGAEMEAQAAAAQAAEVQAAEVQAAEVQAAEAEAMNANECDEDMPRGAVPVPFAAPPASVTPRRARPRFAHRDLSEALPGRFDNPLRVLSLLQAETDCPPLYVEQAPQSREPVSSLARPALHSSATVVQQRLSELDAREFTSGDDLARQAMRDASSLLNTPSVEARRYDGLTSLEPSAVSTSRQTARRHPEGRWLAARALEPQLNALLTPDREPEAVETHMGDALRKFDFEDARTPFFFNE